MSPFTFTPRRFIARYAYVANAPPEDVFPLLCPVRETEWITDWSADIVFTDSGLAENNCIFTTNIPGRGKTTYVVTRYDNQHFIIEFAVFSPGMLVEKFDIILTRTLDGKCRVSQTRTFTGLSPEGNHWAEAYIGGPFQQRWQELAKSMNSFLNRKANEGVN
jgi:hypothetical protein